MQYGYRMGKAALNIAGATLARDLKPRSIPVALIHPGVVRLGDGANDGMPDNTSHCRTDVRSIYGSSCHQYSDTQYVTPMLQVNTQMLRGLRSARGVPDDKLTANTLTPDESAERIMGVVEDLNLENTGSFWAADTGKLIGW